MLILKSTWVKQYLTVGWLILSIVLSNASFVAYAQDSATTGVSDNSSILLFDEQETTKEYVSVDLITKPIPYCLGKLTTSFFNLSLTLLPKEVKWDKVLKTVSLLIKDQKSASLPFVNTLKLANSGLLGSNSVEYQVSYDSFGSTLSEKCVLLFLNAEVRIPTAIKADTLQVNLSNSNLTTPKMIDWLNILSCNTVQTPSTGECNTLVNLYNDTNGDNWIKKDNWKQTNLPCDWNGITCTDGHVTAISLIENNLVGHLPDLSALTYLEILDLRHNQLTGSIKGLKGSLQKLLLGDNQMFSGTLAEFPDLSSLTNLQQLGVTKNQLTGSLSTLMAKIPTGLRIIQLDQNQLTGNIPDFKNFTQLAELKLHSNQLSGSIPNFGEPIKFDLLLGETSSEIAPNSDNTLNRTPLNSENYTNPNLQILWLSGNQLSGEIPVSLTNLTQLDDSVGLDLRYNQLTMLEPETAPDLQNFLALKNPTWLSTQTLPPLTFEATPKPFSGTEIELNWTSPPAQAENSFYRIKYARNVEGPYTLAAKIDKNINTYTVNALSPSKTYSFKIETVTPVHNYETLSGNPVRQQNQLVGASERVSVKTLEPQIGVYFSGTLISNGSDFSKRFEANWNLNLNSASKTFQIINNDKITLNLGSIEPTPGFIVEFRDTDNETKLPDKPVLAPNGGTVYLAVGLDTRIPGAFDPTLAFGIQDINGNSYNPYSFTIHGLVKDSEIDVEFLNADGTYTAIANNNSEPVNFGETLQHSENVPTSNFKTFRVTNNGQLDLELSSITSNDITGTGFTLKKDFDDFSLAYQESTTFVLELDTRTPGPFNGKIYFNNNDFDENPYHLSLQGTVTTPKMEVFMDDNRIAHNGHVDFGNTLIEKDIVKTFVVQNKGNGALYLFPPLKLENINGTFVREKSFNRTIIPPNESATFQVKLDPSKINNDSSGVINFNGSLSVASNDNDTNPFTFSMEGNVIIPTQNCKAEISPSECNALFKFYQDTDGPNWTNSPANNWYQTDKPCNWTGITCSLPNAQTKKRQVTKIELASNNLRGSLPNLAALKELETLSLGNNQLSGSIPNFSGFKELRFLDLGRNQLTGSLPAHLNNITPLETLDLRNNQLTGEIPDLSKLLNLQTLVLANNQLTGVVPKDLNNLSQLENLNLSSNELSGAIPNFANLLQLQQLNLSYNQLTGPLPVKLSQLVNLKQLHLGSNQLTGSIPAELNQLVNLTLLYLDGNRLTGSIPAELGQLVNLNQLNLHNNQLRGEIPASFLALTNLTQLNLGYNRLAKTKNTELQNFLADRAPACDLIQTIPPADVNAEVLSATEVQLTWEPIPYTANGGYYQIRLVDREEPLTNTADQGGKTATGTIVTDLSPYTEYCFIVETHTPVHLQQQNALTSVPSAETCITTYSM